MSQITHQTQEQLLLRDGKYGNLNYPPFEDAFLIVGQKFQNIQKLINDASKIIDSNCTKIRIFKQHELQYYIFDVKKN